MFDAVCALLEFRESEKEVKYVENIKGPQRWPRAEFPQKYVQLPDILHPPNPQSGNKGVFGTAGAQTFLSMVPQHLLQSCPDYFGKGPQNIDFLGKRTFNPGRDHI